MTGQPDHWQRIDALFSALLDLPEDQRVAFLDENCRDDMRFRQELQSLLDAESHSAGMFAAVGSERDQLFDTVFGDDTTFRHAAEGQRIGSFRLLRELGQGGMGVVWLAERADGEFEQRVAIKLLRRWMDSEDSRRRFRAERQILSSLDHPNIARLIDGGTTDDGVPWLATEYIEGEPITSYCERNSLDVKRTLQLLVPVIDAVHHAHQKLVVHRDLKPSNILVDTAGRPRLLDFGIAKLLEPGAFTGEHPQTRTAFHPMTPEYAAPEQINGDPITTATDVFQLGLLLYRLLTGSLPERPAGWQAGGKVRSPSSVVSRAGDKTHMGHEIPTRPGGRSLARRLRGDLDVITLKALHETPHYRYVSAAALAEDLRHHLEGRAIVARPEPPLQAVARYLRRHPFAQVALALLLGLLLTLQVAAFRLAAERTAAEREAERATRVKELLVDVFRRADPLERDSVGGRDATVWDALDAAGERIRLTLKAEPEVQAELLAALAGLYRSAGRPASAADALEEARRLYRSLQQTESTQYAAATAALARAQAALGDTGTAQGLIAEALAVARREAAEDPAAAISVLLDAAHFQTDYGVPPEALELFREAGALVDAGAEASANERIELAYGTSNALELEGRYALAESFARAALKLAEQEYGLEHARLIAVLSTLAVQQGALGRHMEGVANLHRALQIAERSHGPTHPVALDVRNNLGLALDQAGQTAEAGAELTKLVELRAERYGAKHPEVGDSQQNLGAFLTRNGRYLEAIPHLEAARANYAGSLPEGHYRRAFPMLTLARALLDTYQSHAAAQQAREAIALLAPALGPDHFAVGIARCMLGEALLMQENLAEARIELAKALPDAEKSPRTQMLNLDRCRTAHERANASLVGDAADAS